jgi:hypothetical protein
MSGYFKFADFLKPPDSPDSSKSKSGSSSAEDVEMTSVQPRYRIRKRAPSESSNSSVTTQNSYYGLQDDVEEPEIKSPVKGRRGSKVKKAEKPSKDLQKSKEKKPPPITVKNLNIVQ